MQAHRIMLASRGQIAVEPITLSQPGPSQVLIEMHYSTISPGTELAWLHGLPNTPCEWPMDAGYCSCGTVRAVGGEVTHVSVGDKVVTDVPHASAAVVDGPRCAKLPEGGTMTDVLPHRLASIALQGVRKAQIQLGQSVAVLGLGVIGNLAGQIARAAGATLVVGVDPLKFRRDIATKCGYDAVDGAANDAMKRVLSEAGFDVIIEATGAANAVLDALAIARRFGTVILLGSSRGETNNVNFYRDVHRKGVTLIGAHDSTRAKADDTPPRFTHATDTQTVLKLFAAKRMTGKPLISDTVSWRDAAKAYERLHAREEELMTICLDWTR